MQEGTFDITSLENAVRRLEEILTRYKNDTQDDAIRDSVIKRFEFTYSVTLSTLRKYFISKAFVLDDVNEMTFNEMVRTANQLNLLKSNLEKWTDFRQMRNLTAHAYDEKIALEVVSIVPEFYEEIKFLVNSLRNANEKN